ncbi:Protein of unknown function, partial [Gryllus bimaculatus]
KLFGLIQNGEPSKNLPRILSLKFDIRILAALCVAIVHNVCVRTYSECVDTQLDIVCKHIVCPKMFAKFTA